jgi:hypothetical protein
MIVLQGLFIALVVLPTTIWSALAVHYRSRHAWLRWLLSLLPLAIVGVSLWTLPLVPWALAVWLVLMAIMFALWLTLRPKSEADWAEGMQVLPRAEVIGDTLLFRNFRDFRYSSTGEPLPRYEVRSYELSRLASLDYFLSHWSGPIMAHTLVSFGFDDGQFLCVSVEARRERWQAYSPIWGLFRSYPLMFVVGDERDIVRLRTNVRRERVYMYRLRLSPEHLRRLLLDYVERIERLSAQPAWYNSVTSNCTTNLFYRGHANVPWWRKLGIFLNGFSSRTMYRLGYLDDSVPYPELQARCDIRERAIAADDAENFSQQIRQPRLTP